MLSLDKSCILKSIWGSVVSLSTHVYSVGYQFFLNYGREEKIDKERWTRKKKAKRVTEKNYSKEEVREVETANSCEEEETLNSCKEENTQLKKYKKQKNLKNM